MHAQNQVLAIHCRGIQQRQYAKSAFGLAIQSQTSGVSPMTVNDFVFVDRPGGSRAHPDRIELSLGTDILFEKSEFRIAVLESGLEPIGKLARMDALGIEPQHNHTSLAFRLQ